MRFGEIFSKSWAEFKSKFIVNSKLIFYLIFIPGLISMIFSLIFNTTLIWTYFFIALAVQIASIFLAVLASTSLVYSTIFNKKDYAPSISGGKKFYWRYLGLVLVQFIFLVLLFFALIIPAIIFGVYWAFAAYIMIGENKGVMSSLGGSYRLVRHNWWRVLGYLLLFFLIVLGIQIIFSIPSWPTSIMAFMDAFKNPDLYAEGAASTNISTINSVISEFFSMLSRFISIPLGIIFSKYLYMALKKEKP